MEAPRVRFEVGRAGLKVSVIVLDRLSVGSSSTEFEAYEQATFEEIRQSITLEAARDDPIFRSYRDLYWTFGMDPTKLRVSSEALLRRVLNGLNLWRVSDLVDVANLASAYHKIPIGLVDDSKRVGDLVVRPARKGETFTRIGGKMLTCRGREIVLADEERIVCFGYATHDSEFTKVSKNSKRVLLLLYGAPAVSREEMMDACQKTSFMIDSYIDCRMSEPVTYVSSD
jgi:DNA/RNA-binding domain of Phe-tRNA-synthetase-like protein